MSVDDTYVEAMRGLICNTESHDQLRELGQRIAIDKERYNVNDETMDAVRQIATRWHGTITRSEKEDEDARFYTR